MIFIDEIDCVRSLPFSTDEFFAGIRECYNRRADDPAFQRLTFCLLGVASPSDLVRDMRMTPFNIGRRIELTDFTPAEAAPLAEGLSHHGAGGPRLGRVADTDAHEVGGGGRAPGETQRKDGIDKDGQDRQDGGREGKPLLERILYWTGGHPYLTQRLCQAAAEAISCNPKSKIQNPKSIDRLCAELFLSESAREKDTNLLFVRERILQSDADLATLLDLYAKVHRGREPVRDDAANPLAGILRLAGLVHGMAGVLRVRNRIYARVFDRQWIREHMPGAELRRQRIAYWRGVLRTATISAAIIAVIGSLAAIAVRQTAVAEEGQRKLRRTLYAAQTNLAEQAWNAGYLGRAIDLLDAQRPQPGEEELRGFEWRLLWHLCEDQSDYSFRDSAQVTRAAVVAGGRTLAAEGHDQIVRFWDLRTRHEIGAAAWHDIEQPPDGGICFSPDGKLIALGTSDGALRLWDVAARREVVRKKVSAAPLVMGGFSCDSRRLVTASTDGTVQLWDVPSRGLIGRPLTVAGLRGRAVAISQDGRFAAAVGQRDGIAWVWQVAGQREVAKLPVGLGVYWLSLSPDGKRLAVGRSDWSVGLWDIAAKRQVALTGHTSYVIGGAFSPDGKILATGSADCTIRLWSLLANELIAILRGHRSSISTVAFSPDGRNLFSASDDKTVKLWDLERIRKHLQKDVFTERGGEAECLAVSPNSRILATGCDDGSVNLRAITENRLLATLPAHKDVVQCLAFSPDGKTLASGGRDNVVKLWDTATWELKATLQGHDGWVYAVAWSPDGRRLASCSADKSVRLWDPASKGLVARLDGLRYEPGSLAFARRGTTLAIGTDGFDALKLWEIGSGKEPVNLEGNAVAVNSVAVSPDGKTLASAGWDDTVRLWDLATGRLIHHLKAHMVYVAFSPDGASLCTGSPDGLVTFWDLRTYLEAATFEPRCGMSGLVFAPDGNTLVNSGDDGTVHVWRATPLDEADHPAGAGAVGPAAPASSTRRVPSPTTARQVSHPPPGP